MAFESVGHAWSVASVSSVTPSPGADLVSSWGGREPSRRHPQGRQVPTGPLVLPLPRLIRSRLGWWPAAPPAGHPVRRGSCWPRADSGSCRAASQLSTISKLRKMSPCGRSSVNRGGMSSPCGQGHSRTGRLLRSRVSLGNRTPGRARPAVLGGRPGPGTALAPSPAQRRCQVSRRRLRGGHAVRSPGPGSGVLRDGRGHRGHARGPGCLVPAGSLLVAGFPVPAGHSCRLHANGFPRPVSRSWWAEPSGV